MKRQEDKPLLRLRVYPEDKSLYFIVNIWPTKEAMRKHCSWQKGKFDALCSSYKRVDFRNGEGRTKGECGQVNFHRKSLGSAVVTHEFTHAAIAYANRINLDPKHLFHNGASGGNVHDDEERFCDMVARMVGRFVDRAHKARVYG